MDANEIKNELHELTKRLATVTTEVLKLEKCMAAHLVIDIVNVGGHSKVNMELKTSEPGQMDKPEAMAVMEGLQVLAALLGGIPKDEDAPPLGAPVDEAAKILDQLGIKTKDEKPPEAKP